MGKDKVKGRKVNMITAALISFVSVAAGVLLIVFPDQTVNILAILVGAGVVVAAVRSLLVAREFENSSLIRAMRIRSIMMLAAAVMMMAFPFIETYRWLWVFFIYVSALALISSGIMILSSAILFKPDGWKLSMTVEGIITVLVGLVLLVNPRKIGETLSRWALWIAGFALIALGVLFFFSCYGRRYDLKEI